MKVLAVTGRLAQDLVRHSACGADVLVLDLDIAAFITPEMLVSSAPEGYDLILIPGAITADFTKAEKALNTKIRLGPKHAADLSFVLRHLDEIELSQTLPACVLFEERMKREARLALQQLESEATQKLMIKGVKIGGVSRMKVLAEIVDATKLSCDGLVKRIRYCEDQGADMIDLGLPLDAEPLEAAEAVKIARSATDLPISIDAVRFDLILAGVEAGADLILSLNDENLPLVGDAVAEAGTAAVVIPGPGRISLEENLQAAQTLGISCIADPVLSPPLQGLAESLQGYIRFKKDHPDMPLFFGAGNVTELLDADSQGANAILAALGAEVGASILFTPEYSPKARGSIRELKTAADMMQLAARRMTPPKDLGIDLLVLKEKRRRFQEKMPDDVVEASGFHEFKPDPKGSFRIFIADGLIVAEHSKARVAGAKARDILNTLIDRGLISRLDHAGYLGRELEKAEIALALGISFVQDEPLRPEKR
ncbi:MAG: dihydropteroate synthase-like protein [Methanotrichaceae archaeon]